MNISVYCITKPDSSIKIKCNRILQRPLPCRPGKSCRMQECRFSLTDCLAQSFRQAGVPDCVVFQALRQNGFRRHHRYFFACAGNAGINQFPAKHTGKLCGQQKGDRIEFRPLRLMNGHGKRRFMFTQTGRGQRPERPVFFREKNRQTARCIGKRDSDIAIEKP